MDAVDFITTGRLNMAVDAEERRVEVLALEAKKDDRVLQIVELTAAASRVLKESAEAHELQRKANAEADELRRKANAEADELQRKKFDEADERRRKEIAEADELQRKKFDEAAERHRKEMAEAAALDDERHRKVMAEADKRLRQWDKHDKGIRDLLGWQRNQTDAFENMITSILEKFLVRQGFEIVTTMPKDLRRVGSMRPAFEAGFEWDGIVHCKKDTTYFLYIVEAKSNLEITGMPARLLRTQDFVSKCVDGTLPRKDRQRLVCNAWSSFRGSTIRGVVGASAMTGYMRTAAADLGFLTVYTELDSYTVRDPTDGATETFTAPLESDSDAESDD